MSARVPKPLLWLSICGLGVSAFATQLVLMRELLGLFSGNELSFGIVLGNWMLLTGLGSTLGRTAARLRSPLTMLVIAQVLIALLPPADILLIRGLGHVVFIRGAEIGVTGTVLGSLVVLAPYCLITGYLLTLACRVLAEREEPEAVGWVYFLDVIGDIVGGLVFSLVLIHLLDHFALLYIPAALNLAFALLTSWWAGQRVLAAAVATIAAIAIGVAAWGNLEVLSTRLAHPSQQVRHHGNSPYGRLVVTETAGQLNFLQSGVPLFSTDERDRAEETVHYAMAQRPHARRVLLIGGGVSGTIDEIFKYPVSCVDYVELDPHILAVAEKLVPQALRLRGIHVEHIARLAEAGSDTAAEAAPPAHQRRLRIINADGRRYVRQTAVCYDVVIVDVPPPSTSQLNRFYTREFFAEVHRVLRPGGVLGFTLGTFDSYLSQKLAELIAVAERTLRVVFQNVLLLPGGAVVFLASDGELTAAVAERLEHSGIPTQLVNRHYLRGMFTPERMRALAWARDPRAPVNRDLSPILYFHHLRWWMSQFRVRFGLLEATLLLVLAVYLVRMRAVPLVIFTAGFAGSVLMVVLIMGLQVLYGYVYHQVGLLVAMFMLGLGVGSGVMNRSKAQRGRKVLAALAVALAGYAAGLPLVLIGLSQLGGVTAAVASQTALPLLAVLPGALVGAAFAQAAKTEFQTITGTAAQLYTADYLGAALGALLVSTWLIPVLGVTMVCLLTAGMSLASAAVLLATARNGL
jgi:spermidine synthase